MTQAPNVGGKKTKNQFVYVGPRTRATIKFPFSGFCLSRCGLLLQEKVLSRHHVSQYSASTPHYDESRFVSVVLLRVLRSAGNGSRKKQTNFYGCTAKVRGKGLRRNFCTNFCTNLVAGRMKGFEISDRPPNTRHARTEYHMSKHATLSPPAQYQSDLRFEFEGSSTRSRARGTVREYASMKIRRE